ncbi:flagellar protein FliT [Alcanivorax marinus]|uniref:Flagellar protein FliT n=1 Tax=Alloalcanivorax marinus TaxID=1177169 RepID=A0A9Q3YNP0_9GAMM|nr:flagellar protein FliT [Alloalcanivorax marinus]MCC4310049.1 flagellar protein FliT [Alloalcanivorax marinus]
MTHATITAEQVMRVYEGLARRTLRMETLAREGDWGALVEEESHYVVDVEWLARCESGACLSRAQQERKSAVLGMILEREQTILGCLLTRRDELNQLIGLSRRQRDLTRSYGPQEAAVVDGRPRFEKGRP